MDRRRHLSAAAARHQQELLTGALHGIDHLRRLEPRLSIAGLQVLLFIAETTFSRDLSRIPYPTQIAQKLDMTSSGVGRLLDALSNEGRGTAANPDDGLDLIISGRWFQGTREGFVLTRKGKELVVQLFEVLYGPSAEPYDIFDYEELKKHMVTDAYGRWRLPVERRERAARGRPKL